MTTASDSDQDVFIARYRSDGSFVWANALVGDAADNVTKLIVDRLGFVHLIGTDFAGSSSFLATFSGKGRGVRFNDFGGNVKFECLTADRAGNLYLAGISNADADLDPSSGAQHTVDADSFFLLKLDGKYNYAWHVRWDTFAVDIRDLAADPSGIFMVGEFDGTLNPDFNPGHRTLLLPGQGDKDAFVVKYTPKGALVFGKNIGGSGYDSASSAALDPATGDLLVAGLFSAKAFVQPGASSNRLTSQGDTDLFLARYTSAGKFLTATPAGSPDQETEPFLAVTPTAVVLAGGLFAPIDLNPGPRKFLLQPSSDASDGPEDGYIAFFKYA